MQLLGIDFANLRRRRPRVSMRRPRPELSANEHRARASTSASPASASRSAKPKRATPSARRDRRRSQRAALRRHRRLPSPNGSADRLVVGLPTRHGRHRAPMTARCRRFRQPAPRPLRTAGQRWWTNAFQSQKPSLASRSRPPRAGANKQHLDSRSRPDHPAISTLKAPAMQLPDAEQLMANGSPSRCAPRSPRHRAGRHHTGGVWLAERLHALLGLSPPLGSIDVSFYRDDYASQGPAPASPGLEDPVRRRRRPHRDRR
jgi:hypothetical protein